ncbi:peptide MFS transporter [Luteimonas sp. 8-5]|uniref:peptide MFS transporter n=1 Tax=Luteimonas sp. 8-5 TaxID=3039387 RepID=UPI0024371DCA|nr:peptide MFS transporter [Luteimonas sp. 8-5]MDG6347513.1 peptide MFS transporter [Luteimonas sp. 8-5]
MNAVADRTWFGQPRGLTILFLTQMWEMFSYYGMRTLLVYYMTKELLFAQEKASFIYGAYTAMAYFTPILGGAISDRWLGKRNAVVIGGGIMALGHFAMAFEPMFYFALGTIALGNGLFLPSLPSQINDLYAPGDPRRGRAWNVYYVGLNIGGFMAPLVCGTLGELYGWHYGFGAAGIGMFAGLVIYLLGRNYLPPELQRRAVPATPLGGERSDRRKVFFLLLGVGIAATIFRGAYEQVGNTLPLWIDTGVDRAWAGSVIPMTWFQSLNPLLVIAMTPFLLWYWRRRSDLRGDTPPAMRMAAGALIVAAAYLMLALVTALSGEARASWLWVVAFFAILTFGELHILPTGLGLFAKLAPPRLGATTVASWFLAIFSGSLLAGLVGALWSSASHSGFFLLLAGLAVAAAALLWWLDRPIRSLS